MRSCQVVNLSFICDNPINERDRRGRDHIMLYRVHLAITGIYNYYRCNQGILPLMLWVQIQTMTRYTQYYNITGIPIHGEVYSIQHYVIEFVSA